MQRVSRRPAGAFLLPALLLIVLLPFTTAGASSPTPAEPAVVHVQNAYFQVGGEFNDITILKIDPTGTGSFATARNLLAGKLVPYTWTPVPRDPVAIFRYGTGTAVDVVDPATVVVSVSIPGQDCTGTFTIVLGIEANATHLVVNPVLPAALDHAGVHGLVAGGMKMIVNATRDAITFTWLAGTPVANFTIAAGNATRGASELHSLGTLSFSNDAANLSARAWHGTAVAALDAARAAGKVFTPAGVNASLSLGTLVAAAWDAIVAGNHSIALATARAVVNATGFLLTGDGLLRLEVLVAGLDGLEASLLATPYLHPRAHALKAGIAREFAFARASLARGAAGWFHEHVSRAAAIHARALAIDAEERPLLLHLYVLLPVAWAAMGVAFAVTRRRLARAAPPAR